MPDYKYVGHPSTRIDGLPKVTGAAQLVPQPNRQAPTGGISADVT